MTEIIVWTVGTLSEAELHIHQHFNYSVGCFYSFLFFGRSFFFDKVAETLSFFSSLGVISEAPSTSRMGGMSQGLSEVCATNWRFVIDLIWLRGFSRRVVNCLCSSLCRLLALRAPSRWQFALLLFALDSVCLSICWSSPQDCGVYKHPNCLFRFVGCHRMQEGNYGGPWRTIGV